MATTLFENNDKASKGKQHLPTLKPSQPFNMTNLSDFARDSYSKKNTKQHVKRVLNIQASQDNRVIFIDALTEGVSPQPQQMKTSQPMNPKMPKIPRQDKNLQMLATNKPISRKSRASPFQATGPFSIKTRNSTNSSLQMKHQLQTNAEVSTTPNQISLTEDQAPMTTRMPALSKRYGSLRPQIQLGKESNPISPNFIFNDINNLSRDLRKNSVLVKPIF